MTLVKPRMLLLPSNAAFLLSWCLAVGTAIVVVENDEYQNVLVAISPGIKINDDRELLKRLQDVLIQTSNTLFKATGISFGDVIVLLPYTWGTLQDLQDLSSHTIAYSTGKISFRDADILVDETSNSIFGGYPFTIQDRGCGEEGVRITIPKDFLSAEDAKPMTKGKLLAREWIRYRYGVFDENGYMNDSLYPLYFTIPGSDDSTIHVNECTDKPAFYVSRDSNGEECTLSVDKMGLPTNDSDCTLLPELGKNEDITSSLMYFQNFPNMEFLCGNIEHPHNSMSPNKQNILCKSQSIWSVLKKHQDFEKNRSESDNSPRKPRIRVILDRNPRVVIAALLSKTIGSGKGSLTIKAMQKFLYEVPDETEIGIIAYKGTAEKIMDFESVKGNRETIGSKLFFSFSSNEIPCTLCALQAAEEMLSPGNLPGKGTIVLFASSDFEDNNNFVNDLKNSELCLVVIYFTNNSTASDVGFKQLLRDSPCSRLWKIPYEESSFVTMSKLSEIFSSISQWQSYHNEKFTLMMKDVSSSNNFVESFSLDPTIGSFQVWLTNYAAEYISSRTAIDDISLKSNNGNELKPKYVFLNGFYLVLGNNTEETVWTYTLKDVDQPLFFQVTAIPLDSNFLKIRTWVKNPSKDYSNSQNGVQMPLILFAEVTVGIHPVLHAEVVAKISTPTGTSVSIQLLDNGLGDPDVTKYDGIYSRYFTKFTQEGDYEVTVTAKDNEGKATTASKSSASSGSCCGSFVAIGDETSMSAFIRTARTEFFAISGRPEKGYKPSRIRDLHLIDWTFTSVTLQWTAPGNEMDEGTVASYDVKMFSTKNKAENEFDEPSEDFDFTKLKPQPYQETENLIITFKSNVLRNKTYFFSVRSRSQTNEISDPSNVVLYFLASTPSTRTPKIDEENGKGDGTNVHSSGISGETIGIIAGVAVGIVFLLICVYVLFYIFYVKPKRRREEDQKEPNSTSSPKSNNETQAKNRDNQRTHNIDDGTVPADEWQIDKDPINPIQAWPASVLVNHLEKVKEAKRKNQKPPTFNPADLSGNVKTISNGLLPNAIYGSYAEEVIENQEVHSIHELSSDQLDNPQRQSSIRRVTNV